MYTRELYFQMIPIMTMHPNTIPTAFIQLSLTVETVSEKGANFLPVPIAPIVNAVKNKFPLPQLTLKLHPVLFSFPHRFYPNLILNVCCQAAESLQQVPSDTPINILNLLIFISSCSISPFF